MYGTDRSLVATNASDQRSAISASTRIADAASRRATGRRGKSVCAPVGKPCVDTAPTLHWRVDLQRSPGLSPSRIWSETRPQIFGAAPKTGGLGLKVRPSRLIVGRAKDISNCRHEPHLLAWCLASRRGHKSYSPSMIGRACIIRRRVGPDGSKRRLGLRQNLVWLAPNHRPTNENR